MHAPTLPVVKMRGGVFDIALTARQAVLRWVTQAVIPVPHFGATWHSFCAFCSQ